ncbi:MAG TPA: UDP-3-O-acyl-N-acetylglucosamine deacetylase [Candidatus Methanoperedens sp.]|nr:UDP-3-O-acyl-N-acetylglucosamine deacetylase [Candidatus Methanoperedens sp.]
MSLRLRSQRTLAHPAGCCGIGLHSGMIVNLELRPLPTASGIVFQRVDLPGRPTVAAAVRNVVSTAFATTLESRGVRVGTVEHLLAALVGLGVDNALVQVDAPEVPILDGSALPFVDLVRNAGVLEQEAVQPHLRVLRPVEIVEAGRAAGFYPADGMDVTCRISFAHPLIGEQRASYRHNERDFARGIGPARTFGLQRDVEVLLESGMARGGSTDNAVVLSESGVLNEGGLRFQDEFVRHKILDCLGDMALLGYPVLGHLVAIRSGHELHARLMRRLVEDTAAWRLLSDREIEPLPTPPAIPAILV